MQYCHILLQTEIKDGRLNIRENSLEPATRTWFEEHTGKIVAIYRSDGSLIQRGITISRRKGKGWRFSCGIQTFDRMQPGDVVVVNIRSDGNLEIDFSQQVVELPKLKQPLMVQQMLPTSKTYISQFNYSRNRKRALLGEPLNFRGLQHSPINEQGVVFLFGMVCKELGYLVEAVQTGFPDCEAKRWVDNNRLERVRIEFEFKSSNFVSHGHNADLCDLIVCWEHDWKDCPIEVLELRQEIQKLDSH